MNIDKAWRRLNHRKTITITVCQPRLRSGFSALGITGPASLERSHIPGDHLTGNHSPNVSKTYQIPRLVSFCNGDHLPITQNLYDALKNFQEIGITGLLWVDALCINQDDAAERVTQVLLMGKIYARAAGVLIWLGPLRSGFDDLQWATTIFASAIEKYVESTDDISSLPRNIMDLGFHRRLGIEDPPPRLVRLAQFYMACRWFSRAWVIQEVLLARRARAFCGPTELDWVRFMDLLVPILTGAGWFGLIIDLAGLGEAIEEPQFLSEGDGAPFSYLWFLLLISRSASCQDSRDHIYSVLGIASREINGVPIGSYIVPDYDIAVKDLYVRTTRLFLERSSCLDILSHVGQHPAGSSHLTLPSWVPDYTSNYRGISYFDFAEPSNFDASLCSLACEKRFSTSETTLKCTGGLFTTIEEAHVVNWDHSFRSFQLLFTLQFCLRLPPSINGRRRLDVLWRTLIINTSQEGLLVPPSYERLFLTYIGVIIAQGLHENADSASFPGHAIQQFFSILDKLGFENENEKQVTLGNLWRFYSNYSLEELADDNVFLYPYVHSFGYTSTARRLLRTENGRLGLGTVTARKGDQVWLICNAHTPYVLRPVANSTQCTLVGDCYFLDLMNGEMLEDQWGVKEKIESVEII